MHVSDVTVHRVPDSGSDDTQIDFIYTFSILKRNMVPPSPSGKLPLTGGRRDVLQSGSEQTGLSRRPVLDNLAMYPTNDS